MLTKRNIYDIIIEKGGVNMSILQEYEKIRKDFGEERYSHIEAFLEAHEHYLLSDVYYRESVWKEFEVWEKEHYKDYVAPKSETDFPECLF